MGIYINTDSSGKFLDMRYVIDSCSCNTDKPLPSEYFVDGVVASEVFGDRIRFSDLDRLLSFMKDKTGRRFDTTEQVEEYLMEALTAYDDNDYPFVAVHYFEYE